MTEERGEFAAVSLDWSEWREEFDLDASALWEAGERFSSIVASTRVGQPPLTADFLLALADGQRQADPVQAFSILLDAGELAAANAMFQVAARKESKDRLKRQVTERRNALELEFNRALAHFTALHRYLEIRGD